MKNAWPGTWPHNKHSVNGSCYCHNHCHYYHPVNIQTQESSPTKSPPITRANPVPQGKLSWAAACSLLTKAKSERVRDGAWDHPGSSGF